MRPASPEAEDAADDGDGEDGEDGENTGAADDDRAVRTGNGVDGDAGPAPAAGVPGRDDARARWIDSGADGDAELVPAEGVPGRDGVRVVWAEADAGSVVAEGVSGGDGVRVVGVGAGTDGDAGPLLAEAVPDGDDVRAVRTGDGVDGEAGVVPAEGVVGCDDALVRWTDGGADGDPGPSPTEALPDPDGNPEPVPAEDIPDDDAPAARPGNDPDGDPGPSIAGGVPGSAVVRAVQAGDDAGPTLAGDAPDSDEVRAVRVGRGEIGQADTGLVSAADIPGAGAVRASPRDGVGPEGDAGEVAGPVARRWTDGCAVPEAGAGAGRGGDTSRVLVDGAGAPAEAPEGRVGCTAPRPLPGTDVVPAAARCTGRPPGAEGTVRESVAPTPAVPPLVDDSVRVPPGSPSVPADERASVDVVSLAGVAGSTPRRTAVIPAGARVKDGVRDAPEATGRT